MATYLPTGLLDPMGLTAEQQAALKQDAIRNAALNFGLQALASSSGIGYKPTVGQIIGQAGQAGLQAYQGTFDQQLQNMLRQQQMADLQRKRQAEAQRQQQMQSFIETLPEDQRARFQAFPEQAAEAMFRQPERAPGVVGEFQSAVASGLVPPETTLPQYIQMKKPSAPSATAIAGGPRDTFTEEVAKTQAKDFVAIEKSGREAISKARDITRLDNLLSKIETGGAAAFKQAAGNFGINTKDLPEIQAAQAIINKLVPAQRPPGSGTMSDADLALYKESLPRIINQPGANKEIIRSLKEINDYLIEEGKIAAEVTAGRMTREEGIRKIFALGNPVQEFFDRTQQTAPRGPVRPTQEDQSLILKYLQPGR